MSAHLSVADLRFVHRVAARRVGVEPGDAPEANVAQAAEWAWTEEGGRPQFRTPFLRAAATVEATLKVFTPATLATGLLALCAHLRLEGYHLVAPQGVLAGMIEGMAAGRITADELARWVEDRAIQIS